MADGLLVLKRGREVRYVVWSTVVDAPITYGMTEDELREYIREKYGRRGVDELPARLERCAAKGTSFLGDRNHYDVVRSNRAGPGETCLSYKRIVEQYWQAPDDEVDRG